MSMVVRMRAYMHVSGRACARVACSHCLCRAVTNPVQDSPQHSSDRYATLMSHRPILPFELVPVAEASSFEQLVERLAPAYAVLNGHDLETAEKMLVVGQQNMVESARATCRAAGSRPLLMIYGSDFTPMLQKLRSSVRICGKQEKQRYIQWPIGTLSPYIEHLKRNSIKGGISSVTN